MTRTGDPSARWWQGRRLRLVVLIGILAVLVVRVGLDLWSGRMIATEIARLESQFGSLDASAGLPPPVPDMDNRARHVRAAAALVTFGEAAESAAVRLSFRRFKELAEPAPMPTDLRAIVEANRAALRLLDEARIPRQANWKADYVTSDNTPPLLEIRTMSDVVYLAALLDIEAGRPDDAAGTLASGLASAASLSQEPTLIVQLIRIAIALLQFEGIEQLIARSEPSSAALADLAQWLNESREPDPMYVGVLGELRFGNAALMKVEGGQVGQLPRFAERSFWVGPLVRFGRPWVRLARVRYLRQIGALLEAQAGPRPRAATASAPAPGWFARRLPASATGGIERAIETGDVFMSALGAAELGVALRRFRLDHGAYPDVLQALVPAYLTGLPIDPFTGRPPVYARQGTGFTLTARGGRGYTPNKSALEWAVPR